MCVSYVSMIFVDYALLDRGKSLEASLNDKLYRVETEDPMITGQLSKPLLSFRSEMNAELRGEDKAATSDNELNESLLTPAEPNDSEDTPCKLFVLVQSGWYANPTWLKNYASTMPCPPLVQPYQVILERKSKSPRSEETSWHVHDPLTKQTPLQSKDEDEDDDVDLFGSDDEEESTAAKKLKEERVAQYEAKKYKKTALISQSSILLDMKPWDDETDMANLEACVRTYRWTACFGGPPNWFQLAMAPRSCRSSVWLKMTKGVDQLEELITAFEDLV
ncbi:UNVERIFIED_CONTAM: hypothetical protein FKN15_071520 [Acipenser sinensis]